jgi:hypothetical protein
MTFKKGDVILNGTGLTLAVVEDVNTNMTFVHWVHIRWGDGIQITTSMDRLLEQGFHKIGVL